jgi:hypothetical protein
MRKGLKVARANRKRKKRDACDGKPTGIRMNKNRMSEVGQTQSTAPKEIVPLSDYEILIRPRKLISMANPPTDCVHQTMRACTLLVALGIPCELVTVATDPTNPDVFDHVYLEAINKDGTRVAMDLSGPYPGWEPPQVYRRKRWGIMRPEDARPEGN